MFSRIRALYSSRRAARCFFAARYASRSSNSRPGNMLLRHLPFAFDEAPSTCLRTKRGFFFAGRSRFFGRGARAGRASNVSRHGELDGSLMSIQTWVWWRRNAFAASAREPNHRHAASPTRLISQGFFPWGFPGSLRTIGRGAGGAGSTGGTMSEDRRALDLATVKLSKESPWSA